MLGKNAKVELLKKVPLFEECTKAELRELARIADEIDLREGAVLTREGKLGHEFFVLISGTVRVSSDGKTLTELGDGDWLGEIALLTNSPRTATAIATSGVRTLVINSRDFRRVVENMPSIAMKVLNCVAVRLIRNAQS